MAVDLLLLLRNLSSLPLLKIHIPPTSKLVPSFSALETDSSFWEILEREVQLVISVQDPQALLQLFNVSGVWELELSAQLLCLLGDVSNHDFVVSPPCIAFFLQSLEGQEQRYDRQDGSIGCRHGPTLRSKHHTAYRQEELTNEIPASIEHALTVRLDMMVTARDPADNPSAFGVRRPVGDERLVWLLDVTLGGNVGQVHWDIEHLEHDRKKPPECPSPSSELSNAAKITRISLH
eukprot:CAMPEP_0115315666 /NCGR_PEP_ID=MMETSP0270-20121206/77707_1 /TAXON_ID=71861 /ORGANISM="Scrippsiella trochoidea, Strain CCMP3099" /LENGTH=234 /DNA_ID=CAMNT_0002735013 /DNA_START=60 /DNA_END=764 /DNA_ORIENTATION=+